MKKAIVVIAGGWVFIGNVSIDTEGHTVITSAVNIRVWGTTRGLGEIALSGLPKDAQCDDYGTVRVPSGMVVFTIDCET